MTAGGTLSYTENASASPIDAGLTVNDLDGGNLSSARVTISAGRTTGDLLGFTTQNGITASYDSANGILSLTGTATIAQYQSALRSVTFSSTSENPTATSASRTISWTVTDPTSLTSTAVTSTINITALNDAPTFTATISGTYTEAGTALAFLSSAAVADVDASNFNSGSVTVSLGAYQTGDVLSINNQGTGTGQIGVSGSNVSFEGVTIGTFSGGTASNLVITFNSTSATPAAVQALMGRLRFSSTSNNPTNFGNATTRTATVTLNDGGNTGTGGAQSASVSGTINVSGVNNAPTVTAPGSFSLTEDVAGNLVYTGTPFADVDSASLTVTLSIDDGSINATSGGSVTVGGSATARTFQGTIANLNAFFTTAGNITYTPAANNTTSRTLTTSASDGLLSGSASSTIGFTPVNDAPTVSAPSTFSLTEDTTGNLLYTGTPFADVDSASLTVTLSIDDGSINATSGGSVTVGGSATARTFQGTIANLNAFFTTAGNITYTPAANNTTSRTLTTSASDGLLSGSAISTINFTAVNDAPAVYLGGGTTLNVLRLLTENGGALTVAPNAVIGDIDSTQLQSLIISLTNAQDGSSEVLAANAGTTGLSVTPTGSVLTISGAGSLADYQAVLRTLTYNNTSANPTTNVVRTITVVALDNEGGNSLSSPTATASVSLTSVNNPPVYNTGLSDRTVTTGLPFSFSYPNNTFTDPEGDALRITAQQVSGGTPSALPSWITFNPTLQKFYGVAPSGVTSLVVRVTATDPSGGSATRDFTITPTATLNGNNIAAVGFATAYNLVSPATHSSSGYYQEETNSFTTAASPYAGTNFVFYQDQGVVLEGGIYKFSGNNVPGKLTYINANGDVVTVPSAGIGSVSRPIKTPGNVVQGYYMWNNNGTVGNTDDTATLLVINPSYFANSSVYNSSSDQVDTALNGYLTTVAFSVANASGNEGNATAGTANANALQFIVSRDRSTASATASVQFATSIRSGLDTASSNDFVAKSGTVTFPAGVLTATISIDSVNDAIFENNETFTLTLSNPTVSDGQTVQGRLNNSIATGTILNDDSTSFSIAASGAEEGTPPQAGNPMTFTVTRNGASAVSQSVSYATELKGTGESFASADDFTSVSGSLIFAPGETTKTFTVNTLADSVVETDEVFTAKISSPTNGATINGSTNGTASADGTIEDDENTAIYSIAANSATEGSAITFTITRSKLVDVNQNVSFYTALLSGDTATSGDFVGVANNATPTGLQTVTFGTGEFTKTITVATNQDTLYEGNETFTVVLYALQDVGGGRQTKISGFTGTAKGTIVDNDTLPVFSVAVAAADAAGVVESVPGTDRSIRFVVTRTALSEATQTIDYATIIRDSDSASELDFVPASGTLSFPSSGPNSLSQTVSVLLRNDTVAEAVETFGFAISNPSISGSSLGAPSVATGTILDANQAPTTGTTSVTPIEDTLYVLKTSDFSYSDPEGIALTKVKVVSLPSADAGVLRLATSFDLQGLPATWTDVTAGQEISVSGTFGIEAGGLFFAPAANKNNLNLPAVSFTHEVNDGLAFSATLGTVTINITPVNDAPEGNSVTPSLNAYVGGFITLTESNFGFNDPIDVPNNNFHSVKFTNVPERPVQGVLANEGAVQTQVGSVSNSRTGTLEGARDIRTSAYSQSTTAGTPQFVNAESAGDEPWVIAGAGTFDKRLLGRYGTMYLNSGTGAYYFQQFTGGSTGFQYIASYSGTAAPYTPVYEDLNIPTGVRVTDGFLFDVGEDGLNDFLRRTLTITLTGNGSGFDYESSIWKTVVDNEFVSKDTIVANHVRYSPCFCGVARFKTDGSFQIVIDNNTQNPFTTIQYQVQDDGGTANGGVNLDPTPNNIEIRLIDGFSPVVNLPSERYFNEDTSLSYNGFGASNALYVTYNPPGVPSNQINDITVVVELDSTSRPGTLSLDGGLPSGVTATTSNGRTTKFEIVGTVAFADSVLANLVFTPDADQFSTIDRGVDANPRYPGLNGIGGTDAYAILKVSAKNNPLTGQTQYPTTRADVDMSVINVNDAPVVTGSNPSVTILEDTPTSSTIASLFAGNFSDTKDSYPNPNPNYPTAGVLDGVAITAYTPNAAQGNWQYSATGSVGTWTNLTARSSDATAFAIPASYHLRFNPVANYNGAMPSLTVRLIETGATAVSVGVLDVSTNGGTTRVSSGTVVLSGSVTAVNDAPIASGTASLASINEDTTAPAGASVSSLFGSNFNDSADQMGGSSANEFAGVTIVGYTRSLASGEWQYDVDGGSTWTTLGSVVDNSVSRTFKGTDRLRFLPSTNFNGQAPVLVVRLLETPRSVTTNAQVDVSSNGGSTTISADPVTLTHLVTAVNDAPVASGSATLSSILEDNLSGPGATVGQLFSLNFNDQKDSVANGSNANSLAGVALVGYAEDTLKGTWQYSANGTDWTTLTSSPTQNSATTIPAGHRLRFVPAANFNGPAPTLSVLLIDSSAGSVNFATGVNISAIGGTTQYSLGQVILNHSVTSVNDAPAGTDKTVSVSSDASYVFMDSDFGFTDPVDSPANRFAKLRVTTLPTVGTLSLNGQPVTSGDLIALSDMIAGKFVFVPPQTGSTSASFTFQVQDDGGTANNGVNLDGSANTLTIDIVAPTSSDLSVVSYSSINEKRTSPTEMFHMFKVVAEAGETVSLSIGSTAANDVEASWNGFSIEYSLDKSNWAPNPVSGGITTQSGDIYVRVNTISEWDGMVTDDSYLEGPERFQLNATAGALTAFGIGEIRDDGTGGIYSGAWVGSDPESLSGRLDDDRVWAVNDRRLSNVLQVVTVDVRSNDGSKNAAISDEIDLNPATPNSVESELVIGGQGTWRVLNGQVTFTRLSSFTRDPNPISYAIRPSDRPGNFVETTATVTIDFPVVTRSDSNATPEATLTAPVTLDVLANDNLGDTPVASTLRFADGTADGATTLVVAQGTWDIADGKIRFTPGTSGGQSLVRDQDPAPVGYFVKDAQGNKSSTTTASVTYQRSISEGLFVVLVNVLETNPIPSQTNALSGNNIDSFYDVRIVDNMPAGQPVVVNGVSFTTNQADSDSAVGRIQWSKPTDFATGLFTRVTVDAKSKPFLSGTFADISLVGNATSTSTQRIQFVAMDMGFQLNAGSYTLASPISGMNNGTLNFTETVGISNQAFPTAVAPNTFNTMPQTTNRSVSWSGSKPLTLTGTPVSLMKTIQINHSTSTRTTQFNAGGKLVANSSSNNFNQYTDWVLPASMAWNPASPLSRGPVEIVNGIVREEKISRRDPVLIPSQIVSTTEIGRKPTFVQSQQEMDFAAAKKSFALDEQSVISDEPSRLEANDSDFLI
jgi:hypothetical protein